MEHNTGEVEPYGCSQKSDDLCGIRIHNPVLSFYSLFIVAPEALLRRGYLDQVDRRTSRGLRQGIHSGKLRRIFSGVLQNGELLAFACGCERQKQPNQQMPQAHAGLRERARVFRPTNNPALRSSSRRSNLADHGDFGSTGKRKISSRHSRTSSFSNAERVSC
jgi:hypothetical protein